MMVDDWKRLNFEEEHQFSECDVDRAYNAGLIAGKVAGVEFARRAELLAVATCHEICRKYYQPIICDEIKEKFGLKI
jgi:hypothetical protein